MRGPAGPPVRDEDGGEKSPSPPPEMKTRQNMEAWFGKVESGIPWQVFPERSIGGWQREDKTAERAGGPHDHVGWPSKSELHKFPSSWHQIRQAEKQWRVDYALVGVFITHTPHHTPDHLPLTY